MFKRGVIIANLASLVIALLISGCAFGGVMVVQNWLLFDGILLSWELTPTQLFITLNCSSRSKRFLGFCVNGLKEIHGSFENVVQAVCHPIDKYEFLSRSCNDALAITRYLNIVYLGLLGSASLIIIGVVFLMIYSRSFEAEYAGCSEVILKQRPRIGLAITSIIFYVLALLGVCLSSILVIFTSQTVPGILAFASETPMFNIEPYGGSLGWGFYLLLLAISLLVVHILALVDSTRMAKKLWNFSQEIVKNSSVNELAIATKSSPNQTIQDSFFIQSGGPSQHPSGFGGFQKVGGSTFLPSRQTEAAVGFRQPFIEREPPPGYAPMTPVRTMNLPPPQPQPQLHPKISSSPALKSVWGFFPINLLPRFNPYNSGMGRLAADGRCDQTHCLHHHHGHHNPHHHGHILG